MARQFHTTTKEELIAALEDLPKGARVAFASDYGDHVHTQQVHRLRGDIEEQDIYESAYSDSGFAVANDEDDEDFDPEGTAKRQSVYIIS